MKTMYGPDLEINDVASGGNVHTANNTIESCAVLGKRKKISMKSGKSGEEWRVWRSGCL